MRLPPALMLLLCLAAPAAAQAPPPQTVVVLSPASMRGQGEGVSSPAEVFTALPYLGREDQGLVVEPAPGSRAWLPPEAAAVLPGPPQDHRERLARLRSAPLEAATARRLAGGLIQEGDSQWLVELAWGRPWRSFMVNRFQDEEHYVYQSPPAEPLLLRFKGGRLIQPLPARLESPPRPR